MKYGSNDVVSQFLSFYLQVFGNILTANVETTFHNGNFNEVNYFLIKIKSSSKYQI